MNKATRICQHAEAERTAFPIVHSCQLTDKALLLEDGPRIDQSSKRSGSFLDKVSPTSGVDLIGDRLGYLTSVSGTILKPTNDITIRGGTALVAPRAQPLCLNPGSGTRLKDGTANNNAEGPAKPPEVLHLEAIRGSGADSEK